MHLMKIEEYELRDVRTI